MGFLALPMFRLINKKLIFLTLQDASGSSQVIFDKTSLAKEIATTEIQNDIWENITKTPLESVVSIQGQVRPRPLGQQNEVDIRILLYFFYRLFLLIGNENWIH